MNTKILGKKGRQKAQILKVEIDSTREGEVLSLVTAWVGKFRLGKGGKRLIFTPNPEMLVEAWADEEFQAVLNSTDINIADGIGLQWASRWLSLRKMIRPDQIISERVTGTDLTVDLVKLASTRGWKVFFLGGAPGVAEMAKTRFARSFVGLRMTKGFEIQVDEGPAAGSDPAEWRVESEEVVKRINMFKPDLLFVAFGHKKQETWLVENRTRLNFGVAMGVGGAFDFLSGKVRRAPELMRQVGLEWLYRLIQEPWRWSRQLKLVRFVWLVLKA